jgi:hypothetical protein
MRAELPIVVVDVHQQLPVVGVGSRLLRTEMQGGVDRLRRPLLTIGNDPMPGWRHLRDAGIDELVRRSIGCPDVIVAVIDGLVAAHSDLTAPAVIWAVADVLPTGAGDTSHSTFVAGILAASRESAAQACARDAPSSPFPSSLTPPWPGR